MEAPTPTYLLTPGLNKIENIVVKKEYKLKINNKQYLFTISHNDKNIFFIIKEQDYIFFYQYKNVFDLQKIIQYLKLNINFYNDINKIIELLDKVFLNQKMIISYNEKDDSFNINVKLPEYFQEYDSNIILKKEELENNEKFEIIIKEINSIKNNKINDNKLEIITQSLNNLKILNNKKLNENEDLIKLLKNKTINNQNKNKDKINDTKNTIISKKIEQSYINNNLEDKKDIKIEKLGEIINEKASLFFKISIIGSCAIGKSSIVQKYLSFPINNCTHTSYYDYRTYLKVNNTIIQLLILDFPGQERFRQISLNLSLNSDLVVIVYKDDYNSFDVSKQLIKRHKEICNKNIHYALINSLPGTQNIRKISKEEGENLSKNEGFDLFMEVSHFTGYNIDNMFFEIIKILYLDKK